MKRLIVAALLVASCTPATTGGIQPSAGTPSGTPASPVASAAPSTAASPTPAVAPAAQATTTPAALTWPRLADLPVTLPIAKARLFARSTKDVYAVVGTSDLWRYDGSRWQAIPVRGAGNLIALTGNADTVWVSTDAGAVAKVDATNGVAVTPGLSTSAIPSLAIVNAANETLLGACTDGANAALIIQGHNATPQLPVRKTGTVVATGKGKQIVFTSDGYAAYRDSDTADWIQKTDAASDPIRGAAAYTGGRSDLDVMAVGDNGACVRLNGGIFQPLGSGPDRTTLNDVGAADANGIFAVGNGGIVKFYSAEAWRSIVTEPSLGNILAVAALGAREIIILTSKGQVFAGPYIQYL